MIIDLDNENSVNEAIIKFKNDYIKILEERIDKAIEYIEKYNIEGIPFYSVIKDDLLNILQGSEENGVYK